MFRVYEFRVRMYSECEADGTPVYSPEEAKRQLERILEKSELDTDGDTELLSDSTREE